MAMTDLWAYLTPERRRDLLVTGIAEYVFTALYVDVPKGCYTEAQIEQLVAASADLLQLVDREGLDDGALERVWQHKWWFEVALSPGRVGSCVAELAKTFTADSTEVGPLFDFARDLGASDG